ncbi:DUF1622 domain-containing protein [Flagellimonas algicola]|uniref:DUF1622 domain-containing protein n=1 Tax=Flagellimonas algicola TaxID=2583815 RepID=A0ABY2WI12_9FLAO|nr:DUF1622 domain-containing protein [Allomuricauda algicola]TMU54488.1 DUF1622 domain-containing protein [Allomuricauda algicola]
MEDIRGFFLLVGEIIDIVGIIILLFGFTKILFKYLFTEFVKSPFKTSIKGLQKIRCQIGIYILLALDFLIASDIIHTIMEITQKQLLELAIMIVLRTGIGFFLGKEIEELHIAEQ